nr:hypothetical protein [Candidatus Halobonum tyrrellensis]
MTTVVDATADDGDGDARTDRQGGRDPFADGRIEVSDREARRVSPAAWLAGARSWLDAVADRLTYGRR